MTRHSHARGIKGKSRKAGAEHEKLQRIQTAVAELSSDNGIGPCAVFTRALLEDGNTKLSELQRLLDHDDKLHFGLRQILHHVIRLARTAKSETVRLNSLKLLIELHGIITLEKRAAYRLGTRDLEDEREANQPVFIIDSRPNLAPLAQTLDSSTVPAKELSLDLNPVSQTVPDQENLTPRAHVRVEAPSEPKRTETNQSELKANSASQQATHPDAEPLTDPEDEKLTHGRSGTHWSKKERAAADQSRREKRADKRAAVKKTLE